MISTLFYLDCRALPKGSPAPVRLFISANSTRAYIPTSITLLPSQWDAKLQVVVSHPLRLDITARLMSLKLSVDDIITRMSRAGETAGLSAREIRDRVLSELYPDETPRRTHTPYSCFVELIESKADRTRKLYEVTLRRIMACYPDFKKQRFEDINLQWLERFDRFMAESAPSRNARNIHLRNLRAVFNRAIDEEYTRCYPFRRFKIRPEATIKRSMSVEALRKIISSPLPEALRPYRDMWVLSFCLIGINVADLCALQDIDPSGRVQYIRAKTHRAYSIKLEPEAQAIIGRHRGKRHLLDMLDTYRNYRSWYMRFCKGLRAIKDELNAIDDGVTIEALTSYWARHTWATVAASLDIPKETIAAGLGHGGHTVTDIYIDFDMRKVDEANRRVLDWVLYGRR